MTQNEKLKELLTEALELFQDMKPHHNSEHYITWRGVQQFIQTAINDLNNNQ